MLSVDHTLYTHDIEYNYNILFLLVCHEFPYPQDALEWPQFSNSTNWSSLIFETPENKVSDMLFELTG